MNNDSVEVTVKGVMPTSNGCAIFLGNDEKTFVIYVDPAIGNAINMTINEVKKERPLTHDLIGLILRGLETSIERVLINDVDEGTFFARIILRMENELGKKIIELDADRMVYVSCNPATQARDILQLSEAGYFIKKFSLVDQFPHTAHVETVLLLEKQV